MIGQTISHYRIEKKLGAGGMGEVYLAQDLVLGRPVALKILPQEFVSDQQRLQRFIREAKAACVISHPGVAHIYEIGEAEGIHFIVMEYIEGQTLATRMNRSALSSDEIVDIAIQIADALQEAHSKGIIHRDIKPANIMVTQTGRVKLVDFGLAKVHQDKQDLSSVVSTASQTELGVVMGTLPYMSPEQLLGRGVDQRTDFFSFGVVLYELVTASLPFQGNTATELADAILHKRPDSIHEKNRQVPPELAKTVSRMLAKQPADRYATAREILTDLAPLQIAKTGPVTTSRIIRRPVIAIPVVLFVIAAIATAVWFYHRAGKVRWAREQALAQITDLADAGKYAEAVDLAKAADQYIPNDPLLKKLWPGMSFTLFINTDPPGSEVFIQDYSAAGKDWEVLGRTPLENLRFPKGHLRIKITREGFSPIHSVIPRAFYEKDVRLSYSWNDYQETPDGMVRIPGTNSEPLPLGDRDLIPVKEDYWLDPYEVINKDFQKFVDAGGYSNRRYWKIPFVKEGREIAFEEAIAMFQDATGRQGPLEWQVGQYPRGQEDYPVTGISWYEAAAYAEFAGKSLPTIYHWLRAAGGEINYQIIPFSNFDSYQPLPAGNEQSMSPLGTYNMAGNVKEWCWNPTSDGKRYILGGSYLEPGYLFMEADRRDPFERRKTFGFRCAKYSSKDIFQSVYFEKYDEIRRDYSEEKPVSDEVFSVLKTFYDYEKQPLNPKTESVQQQGYLTIEKITFDAAYGEERMSAYLFLPANVSPPYQTIVYFPGSGSQFYDLSDRIESLGYGEYLDFLIRSGRAVVHPIYQGTYERGGGAQNRTLVQSPEQLREWRIQYIKDVRRTMDYLETRKDIDQKKIAYYGYSWGARIGSVAGAVENRFKTMILEHGGFPNAPRTPETDELNFAPRVQIPVLMINGNFDHVFPIETSQKPMFHLLGTPEPNKKHFIFEGGHTSPRNEVVRLILDWLDRYLGPLNRTAR
jgi:dienelactone hydrolase/predicted Ser/Thr protein kinase